MAAFLAAAGTSMAADVAQGAVTASFAAGQLTVTGEGADAITITCGTGFVEVNGVAPTGGPVGCGSVSSMSVTGGNLGNVIDLGDVISPSFNMAARSVDVDGAEGNDTITGSGFGDDISGGEGPGPVMSGSDSVVGAAGDDSISGYAGADSLHGGLGDDTLVADADGDRVEGGDGNDSMPGTGSASDEVLGFVGDTVLGGEGNDFVEGNLFNDSLSGDLGIDTVHGAEGDDSLAGGGDDDTLDGGLGTDVLDEQIALPFVTLSDTLLSASDGPDGAVDFLDELEWARLVGTSAGEQLRAVDFSGPATLLGLGGADTLEAGGASTSLDGGSGGDQVTGGANSDSLVGGSGADTVSDGSGSNAFFVRDSVPDEVFCGIDEDTVTADLVDQLDPTCSSDLVLFPPPPDEESDAGAAPPAGTGSTSTQTGTPGVVADVVGPVMAIARTASFKRGNVLVKLACPAAEPAPCAGRLSLETASAVTVAGAPPPTAAQTRRKRRLKLGSRSFSVAPGKTATLKMKISKRNLRTLTKLGRVRIKLRAAARDQAGNAKTTSRTVAVKFPRPTRP